MLVAILGTTISPYHQKKHIQDQDPIEEQELQLLDAYWRATNYLSVGQIYLRDNPLLREPLKLEHVKRMLLGHWGTTPGQNFIYVHLNRVIKKYDPNMFYISGPGHGGPAMVSQTYLEGTYSEIYPDISQDEPGLEKYSNSSLSRAAYRATYHQNARARCMKAGNWVTRSAMPSGLSSITPTLSRLVWSVTARRRPDRWRPPGTPINS